MDTSKLVKGSWSVLMCLVLAAGIAVAKERGYGTTHEQQMSQKQAVSEIAGRAGDLQSAKKAIGLDVQNLQGEELGSIRELVFDDRNRVSYVIISHENAFHPVPYAAFTTGDKGYVLDITTENLRQAPDLTSVDIDKLSSPDFNRQVGDFYSKQISAREGTGERAVGWMKEKAERVFGDEETASLYKSSETIGMDLQDTAGDKIARLSDIVFDVREGSIVYGLASYGGFMGIGSKTAAVPFSAITLDYPQGIARLDADRSTLDSAVIPKNDLHKLNEPMFARDIHSSFAQEPYWEVYGYVPPTAEGVAAEEVTKEKNAWLPDSDYNKSFKLDTVTTFEGTIESVGTFTPARDAPEGLKLKIETVDDETLVIHAGPQSHYMSQDIRFSEGDRITVIGSKARPGLSLKSVIMATEIKKGDDTLKLRDEQGRPLWKVDMSERPLDDKDARELREDVKDKAQDVERDIESDI